MKGCQNDSHADYPNPASVLSRWRVGNQGAGDFSSLAEPWGIALSGVRPSQGSPAGQAPDDAPGP